MVIESVLLLFGPGGLNWNGPASFTLQGHSHGHRFTVTFTQANFKPRGRHIYWRYLQGSYEGSDPPMRAYYPAWRAGGKSHDFRGYDSISKETIKGATTAAFLEKRNTELVALKVVVDGKKWTIPTRLWAGCLDPNFGDSYEAAKLSKDGHVLTLTMYGSDGGGGYQMTWTLRKNGHDSAHEEGPP